MPPERRRVAVTGLGAITPLGEDVGSTWDGMLSGQSGIGPISLFDTDGFRTTIAGEVRGWEPEKHFDRREVRRLDRFAQFFLVAVRQALQRGCPSTRTILRRLGPVSSSAPDLVAWARSSTRSSP